MRFLRREGNHAAVRDFSETTSASISLRSRIWPADGIKETTKSTAGNLADEGAVGDVERGRGEEEVAPMMPKEQGSLYEAARSVSALQAR